MNSWGKYISKRLLSFAVLVTGLGIFNALAFFFTFYSAVSRDYGVDSPLHTIKEAAAHSAIEGMEAEMASALEEKDIWAMTLDEQGKRVWTVNVPEEIPSCYTIAQVAAFSRGYIAGYPVFVWALGDGLLVMGYPKDSYTKLTGNYYSIRMIRSMPVYAAGTMLFNFAMLFFAYVFSKRDILRNTGPLMDAIESLGTGRKIEIHARGELAPLAQSVLRASRAIRQSDEARANWIRGVSHDIRTPLSVIMGYADRFVVDESASVHAREQAYIIRAQSERIKALIEDLNLVSQLEYDMQPIERRSVRAVKLMRSAAAEGINAGMREEYALTLEIAPGAEEMTLDCDQRLIERALLNLIQNSVTHNPQGCRIALRLERQGAQAAFIIADDGVGISPERLRELYTTPHYMQSDQERYDLRHGLGLLLVKRIAEVHAGTFDLQSPPEGGCRARLLVPLREERRDAYKTCHQ